MKKLILILCILAQIANAQTKSFTSESRVTETEAQLLSKSFKKYSIVSIDEEALNSVVKKGPTQSNATLQISKDLVWNLTIVENDIRSAGFKATLVGDDGEKDNTDFLTCNTYAGYVNGDPEKFIRLYIDNEYVKGIISNGKKGFYSIETLNPLLKSKDKDSRYIIYSSDDVISNGESCGVKPLAEEVTKAAKLNQNTSALSVSTTCRILEVAVDADHVFNSFTDNATVSVYNIMNSVDGIYQSNFSMRIMLTAINVYTTVAGDPYSATSNPNTLLSEMETIWNTRTTKRDVAHLFTARAYTNGVVGLAWTGKICSDLSKSIGITWWTNNMYLVTSHELGHGLNATHVDSATCATTNSLMCIADGSANIAASSQTQISNWITSHETCFKTMDGDLSIIGPNTVCAAQKFRFNILNTSVTWSSSNTSILTINSSTGESTPVGTGQVTISATINTCGISATVTKVVYVGTPATPSLTINSVTPYGAVNVTATNVVYGTYNWYRDNGLILTNVVNVTSLVGGTCGTSHNMTVSVTNTCGTSAKSSAAYYSFPCSFMIAYPNPASDQLTFEFASIENAAILPEEIKIFSERSTVVKNIVPATYDRGNFVDGNKMVVNMKDVPKGTYYVHVKPNKANGGDTEIIRILIE